MTRTISFEHAFKVGDRVTVFNRAMNGRLIIEGSAIVKKLMPSDHLYRVEFIGCSDEGSFERRVEPGPSQDNPMAFLAETVARESLPADRQNAA